MSEAYESVRVGLEQALRHATGESKDGTEHRIRVPQPDVAAIRAKAGLSQQDFARSIGVAVGTLRGWEQGRRRPDGPARVLLALLAKRPTLVQEELNG